MAACIETPSERDVNPGSGLRILAAMLTAFLAGACVMTIEVTAGRFISKEMGASLYTWTSVIGVVLAGLTLGNALGGRLADRFGAGAAISVLFLLSSISCLLIPMANTLAKNWPPLWERAWQVRVAARVTIPFFTPAFLLGAVGPIAAKLALDAGRARGRTVGSVYAWNNVGSIAGTFLAGFWLIARLGTSGVFWLVAGVLAGLSVMYAVRRWWAYVWAGLFTGLALTGLGPWTWAVSLGQTLLLRKPPDPQIVYENESQYSYISVRKQPGPGSKRDFILDKLVHSTILLKNFDDLQYPYENIYAALTFRFFGEKRDLRTLTVGGGGYVFPRYLAAHWPEARIDVAEIDPAVTRAAREAFGLPVDAPLRVFHMDGRNLIEQLVRRKRTGEGDLEYDVVYGDAVNDCNVPFHLTTVEYVGMVGELLTPDGMYLINLIDIFDSGRFLGAVVNTFREVFEHVYVLVPKPYGPVLDKNVRDTFNVIGSRRPLDLADLGRRPSDRVRFQCSLLRDAHLRRLAEKSRGIVLTDDYAPVENLLATVVSRTSETPMSEMLRRGGELLRAGRPDKAERFFRDAGERDPLSRQAINGLARSLIEQKKKAEAITFLEESLQQRPGNGTALMFLGRLLTATKRYDEAIKFLERATAVAPNTADPYFLLGETLFQAGRRDEALQRYREAFQADPEHIPTRFRLAAYAVQAGQLARAEQYCRGILEDNPRHRRARSLLGRTLTALGRYAEAIKVLEAGLGQTDESARLLNDLAWILATCPDDAFRDGRRAVELAERACTLEGRQDPYLLGTLSAAYAEAGRFDKAVKTADAVLRLAEQLNDTKLRYDTRRRREAYRNGKPFRDEARRPSK